MELLVKICLMVCDEMWPMGWMDTCVTTVWCLRDGKTQTCFLLRIGVCSYPPPINVVTEMAHRLAEYGIVERPDWFPLSGKP